MEKSSQPTDTATARELELIKELFSRVGEEREKAIRQAGEEREKAAGALRRELSQRTLEGDERLREHVQAQRDALEAALISADLLERERIALVKAELDQYREATSRQTAYLVETRAREQADGRLLLEAQIQAVASELSLQAAAQKEAILKAEAAATDKFESHNDLIGQMRDQAVKAEQTLAVLVATLLPRETFETYKEAVEQRLNRQLGERQGGDRNTDTQFKVGDQRIAIWAIVAAAVVGMIAIVVTLALHGGFSK